MSPHELINAPLGKKSAYVSHYQRDLLFPLPRQAKRAEINLQGALPFIGHDIWNSFELSWLNAKGKRWWQQRNSFFLVSRPI